MNPFETFNLLLYKLLKRSGAEYTNYTITKVYTDIAKKLDDEEKNSMLHIKQILDALGINNVAAEVDLNEIDLNSSEKKYIVHVLKEQEPTFYFCLSQERNGEVTFYEENSNKTKKVGFEKLRDIATGYIIELDLSDKPKEAFYNIRTQAAETFKKRILRIENFLSEEECEYIIGIANPRMYESMVANGGENIQANKNLRNSESAGFASFAEDEKLRALGERVTSLLEVTIDHLEGMQVTKYNPGGEYKNHFDAFGSSTENFSATHGYNNRSYTVLLYLNDDFDGGETVFPIIDHAITPKKGMLIAYPNLDHTARPSLFALHRGNPVTKGIKYLVTWFSYMNPLGEEEEMEEKAKEVREKIKEVEALKS